MRFERHSDDIRTISRYILTRERLPPKLHEKIETWRTNHQKAHKLRVPPQNDRLQGAVETYVKWLARATILSRVVCRRASEETMLGMVKEGMTPEEFGEYRTSMFPLMREVVEMIAKDKTPEGEAAYQALKRIAETIAAIR